MNSSNKFFSSGGMEKNSSAAALSGRTILVTRAPAQAHTLTHLLQKMGATVIHCPTIEIVEPSSWEALDRAIQCLELYDWVIFTSSNGVIFFLDRLKTRRPAAFALMPQLSVCAIGPATASELKASGLMPDLVPQEARAEGVLDALIRRVGGQERLKGMRFLIPRARLAREILPVELTGLGAHVDAVEAYQTIKPQVDVSRIVERFHNCEIDAVTFTSPSTVSNFSEMVGVKDLGRLLGRAFAACIGPVTAEKAREYHIERVIQPEQFTAEALAEALAASLGG